MKSQPFCEVADIIIYSVNKRGPKIDLCGTPLLPLSTHDLVSLEAPASMIQ